ncbi:MAG: hypothetical protein Q9191_000615 [Dirinaria sp. TL-2023a]
MSSRAPIYLLSSRDPSILTLFTTFLSANATPPMTIQVVTEISKRVVHAFLDSQNLPASTQVTLIPVLRAGLPMYVAASPIFPNSDTALVQCSKDKSTHGHDSVRVEWMGTNPTEAALRPAFSKERRMVILDTILATGDTLLKFCDELLDIDGPERHITVLCCYASPQALAAVAHHRAVHSVFVAHEAETVDDDGYLVPYTNGDVGDKLFGKKQKICLEDDPFMQNSEINETCQVGLKFEG